MPPRFSHDCDACIYLGSDERYDFYGCVGDAFNDKWGKVSDRITLIARYGNEGGQYSSTWVQFIRRLLAEGSLWLHDGIEERLLGDDPRILDEPGPRSLRAAEAYGMDRLVAELKAWYERRR